jgi:hypothetical protein
MERAPKAGAQSGAALIPHSGASAFALRASANSLDPP